MPDLYIIGGPNGAGKTTAAKTILPEILRINEFVNADEIAKGLSPFNPEGVSFEAGRIMLNRINQLLKEGKSFAFETTLATRSYINLVNEAKAMGYKVVLLFLWLEDVQIAKLRVAKRVSEGGHNILPEIIERRYIRGIANLPAFLKNVNRWFVYNNSNSNYELVADGGIGEMENIVNLDVFKLIKCK